MPEELPVVKLGESLEAFVLTVSPDLEHLHHFQLVLVVGSCMGVAHVLHETLKLGTVLGESLNVVRVKTQTSY